MAKIGLYFPHFFCLPKTFLFFWRLFFFCGFVLKVPGWEVGTPDRKVLKDSEKNDISEWSHVLRRSGVAVKPPSKKTSMLEAGGMKVGEQG